MDLSYSGLIAYGRTEDVRKKLRYVGVSALFLPLSQILLQVLALWLGNYTAASLVAAAIAIVPNFFAYKHFVWRVTSRENVHRQMLIFWLTAMLGVSLATLLTRLVENAVADRPRLVCGAAVFFVQLLGYGTVWVGRFLILDKWLFKLVDNATEHEAEFGEIAT
jgi:putative flippase GtrA